MASKTMIKGKALLRLYSLQNGARRYRVTDNKIKSCEVVFENNKEFEELIISIFLLDKYYPSERKLSFGTGLYHVLEDVREDIEQLITFLTNRKISIQFIPVHTRSGQQRRIASIETVEKKRGAPCLFSGGLDSASGALLLTKSQLFPTLTHTATGNIVFGQARKLRNHPRLSSLPMIITDMRLRGVAADSTQVKTRGLLFLSNALVLASSMGKEQVYLPENGPLMINPEVSSVSEPTKNAHPYLIETLEKIYNCITQSEVRIVPMFKNKTKAEIIAKVLDDDIVDNTWSCFRVQGQSRMCGLCFACFVRRLSALAVGYREPVGTYQYDPFVVERKKLGYFMKFDLDILHDTLVYLKKLLYDDRLVRDSLFMIPEGFFEDVTELMQNFSLDMFLGLNNYEKALGSQSRGPLGKFATKTLQSISQSDLKERENELASLSKRF